MSTLRGPIMAPLQECLSCPSLVIFRLTKKSLGGAVKSFLANEAAVIQIKAPTMFILCSWIEPACRLASVLCLKCFDSYFEEDSGDFASDFWNVPRCLPSFCRETDCAQHVMSVTDDDSHLLLVTMSKNWASSWVREVRVSFRHHVPSL